MVTVDVLSRCSFLVTFDDAEVSRLKNLARIHNMDVNQLIHNYMATGMAITVCPTKRKDDNNGLQRSDEGMGRSESDVS